MEVSPRWMDYNGKSENKMNDLGVPPFMETPISRFEWNFTFRSFWRLLEMMLTQMIRDEVFSGGRQYLIID